MYQARQIGIALSASYQYPVWKPDLIPHLRLNNLIELIGWNVLDGCIAESSKSQL